MTTVFIIAGFNLEETAAAIKEFDDFEFMIKQKGHKVVRVDISYKQHVHSSYVDSFIEQYSRFKTETNIVVGNSFGAVVALLSAPKFRPDELYLCSMSPFFKETLHDRQFYQYATENFGEERTKDLQSFSVLEYAEKLNNMTVPVHFTYGEEEKGIYKFLVDFVKNYQKAFTHSDIREIPSAPHSLRDRHYYTAVAALL